MVAAPVRKIQKLTPWLWVVAFAVVIFIQEITAPRIGDSLEYAYVYTAPDTSDEPRRISSVADLIESQQNFYKYENGRFVVHSLVQPLCAVKATWVFALLDALAFLLLVELWRRLLRWKFGGKTLFLLACGAYIFIAPLNPDVAFQINYLWVSLLVSGFMLAFFRADTKKWWKWPMFVLLGFATGESNEAFTAGMVMALAGWLIFHRKFTVSQWVLGISFIVGFLVAVIAPGNRVRMDEFMPATCGMGFLHLLANNWYGIVIPVVLWKCRRRGYGTRRFFKDYQFELIAVLFQWIVLWWLGTTYFTACMGLRFMLMLILLGIGGRLPLSKKVGTAVLLICFFSAYNMIADTFRVRHKYDFIRKAYMESHDGSVCLPTRLLGKDYRKTGVSSSPLRLEAYDNGIKLPEVTVWPEGFDTGMTVIDTNYVWTEDSLCWIVVQSRRHPATFLLTKEIRTLTGVMALKRTIDLRRIARLDYWSETDSVVVGVYYNHYPDIFKAHINIEK